MLVRMQEHTLGLWIGCDMKKGDPKLSKVVRISGLPAPTGMELILHWYQRVQTSRANRLLLATD